MPIASVKFGFEFLSINQKLNTVFQTVFFWEGGEGIELI